MAQADIDHGQLRTPSVQSPNLRDSMPALATLNTKQYVVPDLQAAVAPVEGVEILSAVELYEHLRNGTCILIDVRGDDRAAGMIAGSLHAPAIDEESGTFFISKVADYVQQWADESLVVFTCQYSAHRAPTCANKYREAASSQQRVAILSGGFRAWEGTGLPVMGQAVSETEAKAADDYAMKVGLEFAEEPMPKGDSPCGTPTGAAVNAMGAA